MHLSSVFINLNKTYPVVFYINKEFRSKITIDFVILEAKSVLNQFGYNQQVVQYIILSSMKIKIRVSVRFM